jgi:hypothetical protein
MGTYLIKSFEVTEKDLADLFLALNPDRDAVLTNELMRWARSYFKTDLVLIHEAELVY